MTYAELAEYINNLTEEQKQMDVAVYVSGVDDEFYPLAGDNPVVENGDPSTDVLDEGSPYLVIQSVDRSLHDVIKCGLQRRSSKANDS